MFFTVVCKNPPSLLLYLQKRGSLENAPFQMFLTARKSDIFMIWAITCFADINIAKKGLLLTAVAWNSHEFLLREVAVSNMFDVHLANTVYLIETEFKLLLANIPPLISGETNKH